MSEHKWFPANTPCEACVKKEIVCEVRFALSRKLPMIVRCRLCHKTHRLCERTELGFKYDWKSKGISFRSESSKVENVAGPSKSSGLKKHGEESSKTTQLGYKGSTNRFWKRKRTSFHSESLDDVDDDKSEEVEEPYPTETNVVIHEDESIADDDKPIAGPSKSSDPKEDGEESGETMQLGYEGSPNRSWKRKRMSFCSEFLNNDDDDDDDESEEVEELYPTETDVVMYEDESIGGDDAPVAGPSRSNDSKEHGEESSEDEARADRSPSNRPFSRGSSSHDLHIPCASSEVRGDNRFYIDVSPSNSASTTGNVARRHPSATPKPMDGLLTPAAPSASLASSTPPAPSSPPAPFATPAASATPAPPSPLVPPALPALSASSASSVPPFPLLIPQRADLLPTSVIQMEQDDAGL